MSKFEESNFYKALQDFFINADKKTFLQFLAEFYNRTEGIIDKDNIQDDLIKELRELYLEFNEKGIDDNIVREKVNYFVENNVKIKDIIAKLIINTNNIENINTQLDTNIKNINSQLDTIESGKANTIYVDSEIGKLNSTIINIDNKKANQNMVNDLKNQVNSLVLGAVGDGNNAEIIQARVYSDYTYDTLKTHLDSITNGVLYDEYMGYVSMVNGGISGASDTTSTTRLRSGFIMNNPVKSNIFRVNEGYKFKIYWYDSNEVYKYEEEWSTRSTEIKRPQYAYFRVLLAKTDDSIISPTENKNFYIIKNNEKIGRLESYMQQFIDSYNNNKIKNVKDYGAKGDGINDDYQAIKNAINDCSNGEELIFPFGTYLINTTLVINKSIRINLCGSTIKCNNDIGTMIRVYSLSTDVDGGLIRDFSIYNGKLSLALKSHVGINITDCARFTIKDLTIEEFLRVGIKIHREGITNQCYEGMINNIKLFGCGELATSNTFGIEVNTADCFFNQIIGTRGMSATILNGWGGNYYSQIHGWYDYPVNRCLIRTVRECRISQSYSDHLPVGIWLVGSEAFAKVSQSEFLFPKNNENNDTYYAMKFEDVVANPSDSCLDQCTFNCVDSAKIEYNLDTNKPINITNSTYKNAIRNDFN